MVTIHTADNTTALDEIRDLFREYEAFLKVDLCFQAFEQELAGLPGRYAPPGGDLLIARKGDRAAGCVALRDIGFPVCEMKRLYVRPEFRRQGLGRMLCERIIDRAKAVGYRKMRLDTLDKLEQAVQLYQSLGFVETSAYYLNPLPGVVYCELDLV